MPKSDYFRIRVRFEESMREAVVPVGALEDFAGGLRAMRGESGRVILYLQPTGDDFYRRTGHAVLAETGEKIVDPMTNEAFHEMKPAKILWGVPGECCPKCKKMALYDRECDWCGTPRE